MSALQQYHAASNAYSTAAEKHRAPGHNCLADDADPFEPLPEYAALIAAGRAAIAAGVDPRDLSPGVLIELGYKPICDGSGRVLRVA